MSLKQAQTSVEASPTGKVAGRPAVEGRDGLLLPALDRLSIRQSIQIFLILLIFLGLGSLGFSLWVSHKQTDDALVMNLAGRQRMLIQRTAKFASLAVATGQQSLYEERMHDSAVQFESVLDALMYGGRVYIEGQEYDVPAASAPEFAAKLRAVNEAWEPLHPALHDVLDSPLGSQSQKERLSNVERITAAVLSTTDAATHVYQTEAEDRVRFIQIWLVVLFVGGLVVLGSVYWWAVTHLLRPIRKLETASQRMASGDMGQPVEHSAQNELGRLAAAFDAMRLRIKERTQEEEAMARLTGSLVGTEDPDEVLHITSQAVQAHLGIDASHARVLDDSGRQLVVPRVAYKSGEFAANGAHRDEDTAFACTLGRCPATGARAAYNCPVARERWDMASTMAVRLNTGDQLLGVLCVWSRQPHDWTENDVRFLTRAAGEASVALVRTELRNLTLEKLQLETTGLRQATKAKDEALSIASHELRAPMTTIMGFSEILLQNDVSATERQKSLQYIYEESRRLHTMAERLLSHARLQSPQAPLERLPFSLPEVAEQAMRATQVTTADHSFVLDMQADLPCAVGDRDRTYQVMVNLLTNAVKYSPAGSPVTVRAWSDANEGRLVVAVQDQGIGIAPEDQARLFTSFQRIDRPETKDVEGAGLGLYIVKGLVEQMGGHIWVKSELNVGSTFLFSLPVV